MEGPKRSASYTYEIIEVSKTEVVIAVTPEGKGESQVVHIMREDSGGIKIGRALWNRVK